MREQKNIYNMSDRELRAYKRELKHKIAVRRRIASLLATICLIAACVFSYRSLPTSADTGNDMVSYKYYTQVTVKYGETLWNIADEYVDYSKYDSRQDYIDEVCSINRLENADDITAGQKIVMPYYSSEYIK